MHGHLELRKGNLFILAFVEDSKEALGEVPPCMGNKLDGFEELWSSDNPVGIFAQLVEMVGQLINLLVCELT